jgi:hypothetical protein
MADQPQERITDATKESGRRDAQAAHGAAETPTAEELAAADEHGGVSPDTAAHYEEMAEKGAKAKGEGRLP